MANRVCADHVECGALRGLCLLYDMKRADDKVDGVADLFEIEQDVGMQLCGK